MGMQVIRVDFESSVHNICADLVNHEMKGSIVTAPFYALSARVIAAAAHVFWLGNEVIQFVPRIIGLAVGVAFSGKPSFARAAQVYSLYFKTLGAQALLGTTACVLPELTHCALELHKPLFSLQLQSFTETLPDLPHIQKDIRKSYPKLDSVAQLYCRLGVTNSQWRRDLRAAVHTAYQKDPNKGPEYLKTTSKEFQGVFLRTLFFACAEKLNQDGITTEVIDGLHPAIWTQIVEYLTSENQAQLIERLKETIIDHEINNYFLNLCKQMTGYSFRSESTAAVLRLFLEKMKEERHLMIRENRCTKKEIKSVSASVIIPLRRRGLLKLIDEAQLQGDAITFGDVTLTEDFHFFGEEAKLVELKQAYMNLNAAEKQALITLCHDDAPSGQTENFKNSARLFGAFYYDVIERKTTYMEEFDPFSRINWADAFIF